MRDHLLHFLIYLSKQRNAAKLSVLLKIECDSDVSIEDLPLKGPGKRGYIVADTVSPMIFLGLRKLGNIFCGLKMFLNKIRNIFVSRTQNCVGNKCCTRGQTGKHFYQQQCIRNNVSSFARALRHNFQFHCRSVTGIISMNYLVFHVKFFLRKTKNWYNIF